MPKIIVTIEDRPNGHVSVRSNPSCAQMGETAMKDNRQLTAAEIYAFKMMEACVELSKKVDKYGSNNGIIKPGDGLFN